jgi:tetratricopeptide (TPR) repeat protein
MRLLSRSLTAAFVLSFGLTARAEEVKPYPPCTQQPTDPDANGARAAFQAGTVSFNEADYPRAILYWEDAYRRDCTADVILFNLARAYELNGQKRQALLALETFLEREPNSTEKPQILRRIEVLKKAIEAEPAPQPAPVQSTTAPPPQPAAQEQPPPPRKEGAIKTGGKPVFPLIIVGVGGVILIVGSIAYLGASADVNEFASHCKYPDERKGCPDNELDEAEDARKRQQSAGIFTLVSLPIIATGAIWYAVAPRSTASARVAPTVGKNFVGLSVDGKF